MPQILLMQYILHKGDFLDMIGMKLFFVESFRALLLMRQSSFPRAGNCNTNNILKSNLES